MKSWMGRLHCRLSFQLAMCNTTILISPVIIFHSEISVSGLNHFVWCPYTDLAAGLDIS